MVGTRGVFVSCAASLEWAKLAVASCPVCEVDAVIWHRHWRAFAENLARLAIRGLPSWTQSRKSLRKFAGAHSAP